MVTDVFRYFVPTLLASCVVLLGEVGAVEPTQTLPQQKSLEKIKPLVEWKVGYFFFGESKMNKVYNDGGWDLQMAGSVPLWRWLQLYGSVEYIERHGHSLHQHQKTSIWEVPLSLGLKSVYQINNKLDYYFTVGPRYFFVRVHNDSDYVSRHIHRSGMGGFIGSGFNIEPVRHLLIDVFGEYSYKRMDFSSSVPNSSGHSAQVGGYAFGAGIGYVF